MIIIMVLRKTIRYSSGDRMSIVPRPILMNRSKGEGTRDLVPVYFFIDRTNRQGNEGYIKYEVHSYSPSRGSRIFPLETALKTLQFQLRPSSINLLLGIISIAPYLSRRVTPLVRTVTERQTHSLGLHSSITGFLQRPIGEMP